MANTCITSYIFKGNREQNNDFIDNLREMYHNGNYKVSDFLRSLGAVGVPDFKGRVIYDDFDGDVVRFTVESDWARIPYVEELLESKYIGSVVLFLEDCLESDIFITNDKNQDYIKTKYAYDDEYIGLDYYEDEESVLEAFNKTLRQIVEESGEKFTTPCTDINDLEDMAEEYDMWVSLHQIEYE